MTGKEVLRAIADGANPIEFEWMDAYNNWVKFIPNTWNLTDFVDQKYKFRRKPRIRSVNGFTVPAPIQEILKEGHIYYLAMTDAPTWFGIYRWKNDYCDNLWLSRGLLFDTKEAAIANAKAMCGIDPESE